VLLFVERRGEAPATAGTARRTRRLKHEVKPVSGCEAGRYCPAAETLAFFIATKGPPMKPTLCKRLAQLARSLWRRPRRHPDPPRCYLALECLEDRALRSSIAGLSLSGAGFRSIIGLGNNLANPTWGQAGTDLIRISPVAYADGISAPSQPNSLSPRFVSNALNDQTDPNNPSQDLSPPQSKDLSDFAYVWGQFIDHDMGLTLDNTTEFFPIAVPAGDPIGAGPLPFTRSNFDPNTGTSTSNPRQQVNSNTAFLDLSNVYGSDAATADALRSHAGGRLKTSPGDLLPYLSTDYFTPEQLAAINEAEGGMQNFGGLPNSSLFAAGDIRANENIELTAVQTLFMRNHNRIAAELQREHPRWSDEQLYQEARKLNIATEEIITYTEFLPAILGPNALPAYAGYNPNVNPGIATEFSTVGFRFGHSLLSGTIGRDTNDGVGIADVNPGGAGVDLAQDFFDPNLISATPGTDPLTGHTTSTIGAILKADADANASENDLLMIRQVRNLLFGNSAGGEDLIARDIQRTRDHGIGTYNDVRAAYGLPRVTSFAQITSDVKVQQKLEQTYGSVDQIDPFEGIEAEDHVRGADVGPTLKAMLVEQFTRLRDGDRFFYLNEHFTSEELNILRQANTLTKVIEANTEITNLQSNVFFFKASIGGTVFLDLGNGGRHTPAGLGLPGFTVNLNDDGRNVIATTTTDRHGRYSFTDQTGIPGTGQFSVSLVLPSWLRLTTRDPGMILISRGDIHKTVNLGVGFDILPPSHGGHHSGAPATLDGPSGRETPQDQFAAALRASINQGTVPTDSFAAAYASTAAGPLPGATQINAFDGGIDERGNRPVVADNLSAQSPSGTDGQLEAHGADNLIRDGGSDGLVNDIDGNVVW
jgi:hypothetical protein